MAKLLNSKQIRQINGQLAQAQSCNGKDIDVGHKTADKILCDMIEAMGYPGIAAAYRGVEKLYDDAGKK